MLLREGWNFDDPNQSVHPCLLAKIEDSSETADISWKEHNGKCSCRFFYFFLKKEKCSWRKSVKKGLWLIIPSNFKTISFENFTLLWRGNSILLQCHADTICTDLYCWYDKYQNLVCLDIFKSSYPTQCCPTKALAWIQIRTRIPRMSAHHKDPSKTTNRSWKEQQDKCLWRLLKRCGWGKSLFYRPF